MKQTLAVVDTAGLTKPDMSNVEWPVFAGSVAQGALAAGLFVEIGVHEARSTRCVLEVLNQLGAKRTLVSVDVDPAAKGHWDRAPKGIVDARFVLGYSQEVVGTVEDSIAWLLIDGCHCFRCVSEDLALWVPKVSPWGVVVLHDSREDQAFNGLQNRCYRDGGRVPRMIEVNRAIREANVLRGFELVDAVETNTRYGIRVYRRTAC